MTSSIVYGPVPSRRLGRSLGINNVPPKTAGGTGRACHRANHQYGIPGLRRKAEWSGVEYLIGYEGNAFACTGNVQEDLLSITSVHPMREEAVAEFLENAGTGWETVQHLIEKCDLVELEYQGKKSYMRRLPTHSVPRS